MDIVGYSKLLVDEQAELVKELEWTKSSATPRPPRQAEAGASLSASRQGMAWRSFSLTQWERR